MGRKATHKVNASKSRRAAAKPPVAIERRNKMTVENIKVIVTAILKNVIGKRAEKVIASMEERENCIIVYLSHGATLGESWEVQEEIKKAGLDIPEQLGNAVIYVTERQEGK